MYVPQQFRISDMETIEKFIQANGFATIVSAGNPFPLATHIPIELETNKQGKKVLWGHIARANPQWKSFGTHPDVLVIFMSPLNHYISSSWYNYQEAPTWNYMSVQITGKLKLLEGEQAWESVRRLTRKYERDSEKPVSLDALPPEVQKQMNGLVAFEIDIADIDAAFKMSQNRDDENFQRIISNLKQKPDPMASLVAGIMEQIRNKRS